MIKSVRVRFKRMVSKKTVSILRSKPYLVYRYGRWVLEDDNTSFGDKVRILRGKGWFKRSSTWRYDGRMERLK